MATRRLATYFIAVLAVVAAGCGSSGPTQEEHDAALERIDELEQELFEATSTTTTTAPPTETITGTFTLTPGDGISKDDGTCWGNGGYDDVAGGLDVVVKANDGTVIGVSRLEDGVFDGALADCIFAFTVEVPADLEFYVLEIGSRGDLAYTHDDLEGMGWTVALTLG